MSDITKIKVDGEPESSYKLFSKNREFEKRAGGNGVSQSGVQSDWNQNDEAAPDYVKNRPFYTDDHVETEIIPETTVTFSEMEGLMSAVWPESFDLVDGQTYTISWDGTDYACTGILLNGAAPVLGNLGIIGLGVDTGEPFVFMNQGQWLVGSTENATEHIISISGMATQVVKIDEKYLPKYSVLYDGTPSDWSNAKKQQMYDDFISGKLVLYNYFDKAIGVVLSVSYSRAVGLNFVFFEGYHYLRSFVGNAFSNPIDLTEYGINSLINGQINNLTRWKLYGASSSEVSVGDLLSMYVAFDSTTNKACISTTTKSDGSTTISENSTIVTNGDSDIVLSSSTSGSTKKFKITVDDSGTISATEVT